MHEALRLELGRHPSSGSVRTVLVCPYHIVDTPMFGDSIFCGRRDAMQAHGPLTRLVLRFADVLRPWVFPPLRAQDLAHQIVDALARKHGPPQILVVPWVLGWLIPVLRAMLPVPTMDAVLGVWGGWHGMDATAKYV